MHEGTFKEMHVKIFNTGKMEIPGVPKDSILNNLLDKLLKMLNSSPLNLDIKIKENSFETVLINLISRMVSTFREKIWWIS